MSAPQFAPIRVYTDPALCVYKENEKKIAKERARQNPWILHVKEVMRTRRVNFPTALQMAIAGETGYVRRPRKIGRTSHVQQGPDCPPSVTAATATAFPSATSLRSVPPQSAISAPVLVATQLSAPSATRLQEELRVPSLSLLPQYYGLPPEFQEGKESKEEHLSEREIIQRQATPPKVRRGQGKSYPTFAPEDVAAIIKRKMRKQKPQ